MGNQEFCRIDVTLTKWDDALALAKELSQTPLDEQDLEEVNWLFRGQPQDWPLFSSLQRAREAGYEKRKTDKDYGCLDVERRVITHFRENAHLFDPLLAQDVGNFEWAARLRHYGGPTRLLDFSRSFWVAAFFALELGSAGKVGKPMVWAVEGAALYCAVKKQLEEAKLWGTVECKLRKCCKEFDDKYYSERMRASRQICDLSIWGEAWKPRPEEWKRDLALFVESGKTDKRIVAQSGAFICPLSADSPVETCLTDSFRDLGPLKERRPYEPCGRMLQNCDGRKPVIVKIYLPFGNGKRGNGKRDVRNGLHILEKMNITRATLFPGMDGLAASLYTHLTR